MGAIVGKKLGNYEILEQIGSGAMGVVFKARQVSMDRLVAIKILPTKFARNEKLAKMFVREARAAGRLSHPNIIQVHDVVAEGDLYYFSMELVDGRTTREMLADTGPFGESDVLTILDETAAALSAAHKARIIHRDVKPHNIMIDGEGRSKLADLGVAHVFRKEDQGQFEGQQIGTPHYMAPEQASGSPVDHRSDLYSLGCTAYHLLTGKTPFRGANNIAVMSARLTDEPEPLAKLRPNLSKGTSRLIGKLMARDPDQRFQTADEVRSAVTLVRANRQKDAAKDPRRHSSSKLRVGARRSAPEPGRSGGLARLGIGAAAAAILALVAVVMIGGGSSPGEREASAHSRNRGAAPVKTDVPEKTESAPKLVPKTAPKRSPARIAWGEMKAFMEENPAAIGESKRRLEAYVARFSGSADAQVAQSKLDQLQAVDGVARAREKFDGIEKSAEAEMAAGRYGKLHADLMDLADGLPPAATKIARDARALAERVEVRARGSYQKIDADVNQAIQEGRVADAQKALRAVIASYGFESIIGQAKGRLEDAAEAEKSAESKAFEKAVADANSAFLLRRYKAASQLYLGFASRAKNSQLKKKAADRGDDLRRIARVWDVAKVVADAAGATRLSKLHIRGGGTLMGVEEAGIRIQRRGAEAVLPWTDVSKDSQWMLVKVHVGRSADEMLALALYANYLGLGRQAMEAYGEAKKLDPTLASRSPRYEKIIGEQAKIVVEADAKAIFDRAQAAASKGLSVRARGFAKGLLEKFANTAFVSENREKIEKLAGVAAASPAALADTSDEGKMRSELKKLGWRAQGGKVKRIRKGLYEISGGGKLVAGDADTGNASLKARIQLKEGDWYQVLVRSSGQLKREAERVAGIIDGANNGGGGRFGSLAAFFGNVSVDPDVSGYGIRVTPKKIIVYDGWEGLRLVGYFGGGRRGGGRRGGGRRKNQWAGIPVEIRTANFNGKSALSISISIDDKNLRVQYGSKAYRNSKPHRDAGEVVIEASPNATILVENPKASVRKK